MIQTPSDDAGLGNLAATGPGEMTAVFRRNPEAAAIRTAVCLMSIVAALTVPGLLALWIAPEETTFIGWTLATACGVFIVAVILVCAMPRPSADDGLILHAEGLTRVRSGQRLQWRWNDLGDFAIARRNAVAGWLFGQTVSIEIPAISDGSQADGAKPRRRETFRLGGGYLASLDAIAATLAAYRDGATGQRLGDVHRIGDACGVFDLRDQKKRSLETRSAMIWSVLGGLGCYAGAAVVNGLMDGWSGFVGFWTDPMSERVVLTMSSLWALFLVGLGLRFALLAGNRLCVDTEGLTLAVGGRRRRWLWDLVAAAEIYEASELEDDEPRRIVFIARHDGFSKDGAVPSGLRPGAVRVVIDDLYDAPLETIVDRMNALRERALAVATAQETPVGPVPLPT